MQSPITPPTGLVHAGQLTVAADLAYPPQEYVDRSGQPVGSDIDLARAIAAQMRLKLKVVNINVDGIVPGFASNDHRYDMGISAQPETKTLDASAKTVPYFVSGEAILIPTANPDHVHGIDDLCGLKVGANRASSGEVAVQLENERPCQDKPIKYNAYDNDVDGVKDLRAGKLDAYVEDYPVTVYFARSYHGLRVVPHQFATSTDVMVFPINDTTVSSAVAQAFERLRRDGTYRRILRTWGLEEGALT